MFFLFVFLSLGNLHYFGIFCIILVDLDYFKSYIFNNLKLGSDTGGNSQTPPPVQTMSEMLDFFNPSLYCLCDFLYIFKYYVNFVKF